MAESFTNRFGRSGGRGLRPWLLIPKVVLVGLYLGSLAAILVLFVGSGFALMPPGDPRRLAIIEQVSRLVLGLMVPSLVGALVLGAGLLAQHPGVFLRLRWLRVKLVLLAVAIPAGHILARSSLHRLREAFARRMADDAAATQFALVAAGVLAISILVVVLGRLKPRLGRRPAPAV